MSRRPSDRVSVPTVLDARDDGDAAVRVARSAGREVEGLGDGVVLPGPPADGHADDPDALGQAQTQAR
jgi:hypothetical protein